MLLAAVVCGCATLRSLEEADSATEEALPAPPVPSDFDTGQFGGVVLQDPLDKRNIQGFVYLSLAWGTRLRPGYPRAVAALAAALNKYTDIRAKVMGHIALSSAELHRRPFVYITAAEAFELSTEELDNLGSYLRGGGFVVADNGRPDLSFGPAEASLRNMLIGALTGEGEFVKIPDSHPIFHSFLDLQGPPFGGDYRPGGIDAAQRPARAESLEGIFLDGRLAVVYSDMGYGGFWEQTFENEPQLKMGINLVVFALTQDGSIAMKMTPRN